mgnify:CR=1 FL=1
MKSDITFLPERKQRDLHELVTLIREEIEDVVMVILYGSYAKNTYVELDERHDFGVRTYYMSDYDLLVVTQRRLGVKEATVNTRIKERFLSGKGEFQTYPQLINESFTKLNHALSEGRYFYVEIVNQGIVLYDVAKFTLATPRELDYRALRRMAQEYYNTKFAKGERFLRYAGVAYADKEYVDCSFFLHQSAEYFIKVIPLVFSLYGYKEHDLHFLCEKSKPFTTELATVFPCDCEEEKRLFELLRSAYIEARYNDKFVVTKADIDALLPKIELLRDVVKRVCKERLAYYESQLKN